MKLITLRRPRTSEDTTLPVVVAILMGVLIGAAVGPWKQNIAWWLLGAAGLLVLYTMLLFRLEWGLLLFLVLLPFQYFDLSAGRLGFVLSPTRLVLPGLVVAWLICGLRRYRSTEEPSLSHPLPAPIVGLLLVVCVSAAFSQNRATSVAALLRLAEGIAVLAIMVAVIRTERLLNQSILAACIAIAIVGFSQVYHARGVLMSPQEFVVQAQVGLERIRLASVFGNEPNGVAHFVAILFPLLLYAVTVSKSRLLTWMLGIAALAAVFGILLTLSRGGMLTLLAGVVVSYRSKFDARLLVLVLLLALVLMTTPLVGIWQENIGARPESATERMELWYAGLRSASEFPLSGTGFGTFKYLHRYASFDWPADLFERANPQLNKSAHNLYLSLVAETGFLSLLFLGIFWWLLWRLLRRLSRETSLAGMRQRWWLVQFLMACSAALLVSRVFTTGFFVSAFWALLGILISASSVIKASIDAATPSAVPGGDDLGESPLS